MSTIKDVAEHAGVSMSTVSHVINSTRFVSPEIRARVEHAMQTLNYKPNTIARSLRNRQTRTFGVLLPDSANPYFARIVAAIEDACFSQGYNIIIGNASNNPERESAYLDVLAAKQVDGMLLISTGDFNRSIEYLQSANVPTVLVDRSSEAQNVDVVVTDNAQGGSLAAAHLLALGHRRIGMIAGPSRLSSSAQREHGFLGALQQADVTLSASSIVHGDFSAEGGYSACMTLLAAQAQPPTALFAANDMMAIGALRALHERGLHVPEDVSVIGYDNISLSAYVLPSLTTIAQPVEQIGQAAVRLLLARIAQPDKPYEREVLNVTLLERDSCRRLEN